MSVLTLRTGFSVDKVYAKGSFHLFNSECLRGGEKELVVHGVSVRSSSQLPLAPLTIFLLMLYYS